MFNSLKKILGISSMSEADKKYRPMAEKLRESSASRPVQMETQADIHQLITALADGKTQGHVRKTASHVQFAEEYNAHYALELERQKLRGNATVTHIIPLGDTKNEGDGWQPTQAELTDFLDTFERGLDPQDIQRIHLGRHVENLTEPLRLRLISLAQKGWVKDKYGVLKISRLNVRDEKLQAMLSDLQARLEDAIETGKKVPINLRREMQPHEQWFLDNLRDLLTAPKYAGHFEVQTGLEKLPGVQNTVRPKTAKVASVAAKPSNGNAQTSADLEERAAELKAKISAISNPVNVAHENNSFNEMMKNMTNTPNPMGNFMEVANAMEVNRRKMMEELARMQTAINTVMAGLQGGTVPRDPAAISATMESVLAGNSPFSGSAGISSTASRYSPKGDGSVEM